MTQLEKHVKAYQGCGWRVSEAHPGHVVMEKGEKIPHASHLLLCVFTLGLWGIFYGPILLFSRGLRRLRLTEYQGEVHECVLK